MIVVAIACASRSIQQRAEGAWSEPLFCQTAIQLRRTSPKRALGDSLGGLVVFVGSKVELLVV